MLRKGDWVWLDSDIGVPIGATVTETPSGQLSLLDDVGRVHSWSPELEPSLRVMHPTSVEGVDDMIKLGDMNEADLLRNLQLRHSRGLIYTYIGSVLVALNPYQEFPIYSDEQVRLYQGRMLGELPPHIFAVAESCYSNMRRSQKNQCCVVSGESGAGKTESTKLMLQYLAAVSGELSEQQVKEQILESNPILEAFGNAKTIRNDNSSRFGKYLEIFFNKDGVMEGARVEQYLLEKSRVCHQALEERNYHIFYCLLAGITAEERKALSLWKTKDYKCLTRGDCVGCEGRDDAEDFRRIRSALKLLKFSDNHFQGITKLLAAILHLGNVLFVSNTENNLETSVVSTSEHFSTAASLLEVQKSCLASSLTRRSFITSRESVTKLLNSEQASDCRDAFVKAIYDKLFVWIVGKINQVIYTALDNGSKTSHLSIGLLDIFGFENFQRNSFEQLCINFANEKLQQYFVSHIFKLEQKEYLKEDITWTNIKYSDNKKILDLLGGKPCNVMALIDEESQFPKGSDITMLNKMNQQHRQNRIYIASKRDSDTDFGIHHFAGAVYYDSIGFLEKNRDAVSSDINKMVDMSSSELLRQIFETELSASDGKMTHNKKIITTPRNSLRAQSEGPKQPVTLSGQFRQSLDSLMKTLSVCQPFFIRCFKPNSDKQPEVFDRELCLRQLRYSGMMDTIRIRKLGFPIRHTFKDFLGRYRMLLNSTTCNSKTRATAASCCKAICESVIPKDQWKVGKTRIFLKDAHDAILESLRKQILNRSALIIQRVFQGHKERKSFLRKRQAAVVLQRCWRSHFLNKVHTKVQSGFERLVSKIHSRRIRLQYQRQKAAALTIQSQMRGYWARKDLQKRREASLSPDNEEVSDLMVLELQQRFAEVIAEASRAITDQESQDKRLELLQLDRKEVEGEEKRSEENLRVLHLTTPKGKARIQPDSKASEPMTITITSSSNPTSPTPSADEDRDGSDKDSDRFSFHRFSVLHFQDNATHTHVSQRLKKPLLPHDDEGDAKACLTLSWIILRFMGDMPEPAGSVSPAGSIASHQRPQRQERLSDLAGLDQKKLKKKNPAGESNNLLIFPDENQTEDEDILIGEGPTMDRTLSALEKLHIIIGYALSRPDIRDEIYCQICKQLVKNRKAESRTLGWTLLSVCLGIFPPSNIFMKYLERFLLKGPNGYKEYCTMRLQRIITNGERKELPCWVELQAAQSKEPIDVSVTLTDGREVSLQLDSASTAAEVCQTVSECINLRDTHGFTVYISFQEKMWSLGSGGKHILDAASQCEQEMRKQGRDEKETVWTLLMRKELFTPWHDCGVDPVSTDLIYRQLIKGIKSGEYSNGKEDEYIQLAAMHYSIRFGPEYVRENVQRVVEECISTELIENKSMTRWIRLISSAHLQGDYVNGKKSSDEVKGDLVDCARQKWPLNFSRFYKVTMTSGPTLPQSQFVVAVNWSGILFMEGRETERKLLEIPYAEVKTVQTISDNMFSTQSVRLTAVKGEFVLKSAEAADMARLIQENLEGLRQRSVFALAQHDAPKQSDPMWLVCKRGDLLLVDRSDESSPDQRWSTATNQRTSSTGAVLKESLQFLPTLSRPTEELLELLSSRQKKKALSKNPSRGEDTAVAPVSLKTFAQENFRAVDKDLGQHGASRRISKEKLWVCSTETLKQPLMKNLAHNSELSNMACSAFTAILKYMGDYPIKMARTPLELTDQIFGPATQHAALQDEIYCQIMKQMTSNSSRLSLERGWQLLWLCSGLFPPSPTLMKHVRRFLESRPRELLAAGCLQRLQEMCSKDPRRLPPHQAELDAIQQNSTQIYHKIHFPNETDEIFEVTSTTTVKDLCRSIAARLRLNSADGYGLYMKTQNKMSTLEDQKYFFDNLRQTVEIPRKGKKVKEGYQVNMPCLVICKRKLWFNVSPGKDLVADLTFHFPQELPKYLHGYHSCTKGDMIKLGGLLFRAKVDSDRSQFVMIPRMLTELVPVDQHKLMLPENWKKHIISSYKEQSGITQQEAKIAFLRVISSWPTFGCAFFEVKQTCEPGYPSVVLLAVSKQGVNIINPKTKEILVSHPFRRITEYSSEGSIFQMTISTPTRSSIFDCESAQVCYNPQCGFSPGTCQDASSIEDIFRSYISMYVAQTGSFQPRNQMSP